jgi:hypothetical protein
MLMTTDNSSTTPGWFRGHDARLRVLLAPLTDLSIIVIAIAGFLFLWSEYSHLSGLSWWYQNTQLRRERGGGLQPDYDLGSLSWKVASPRVFEVKPGSIMIVTSDEPFAYQAFATIEPRGATAAHIEFDVDVHSGGVTIGMQQGGKWIAINSTRGAGPFADGNSAQLSYHRSAAVMIANNNPAGESRLTVKSLRLFLQK